MYIECTANITLSDDGKYVNAVTVTPEAGITFNFKPSDGRKMVAGHYAVKGVMSMAQGVSNKGSGGPRAFKIYNVVGEAIKGATQFVPEKAAPAK